MEGPGVFYTQFAGVWLAVSGVQPLSTLGCLIPRILPVLAVWS